MAAKARRAETSKTDGNEALRDLRRQLGRALKTWREDRGLTQADLAAELGLKYYSFISQVENGIGRIPQDLYIPWADALGVERQVFCWTILEHIEPSLYAELAQTKSEGS